MPAEEREELLTKREAFAELVNKIPAVKDDIANIDATLSGGGIRWRDLVSELEREPAIGMMARVWDLDRSERYHDDRRALARFMLLRELARRPRNVNAMETLGLARLRFPDIERIGKEKLPEIAAERGCSIENWRGFLYHLVDYLRGGLRLMSMTPMRAGCLAGLDRETSLVPVSPWSKSGRFLAVR